MSSWELVGDLIFLLVSICCAIPAATLGLCFGFFVSDPGLNLPITVDGHEDWHNPPSLTNSPLLNNLLLLLVFPLQHSFTLRGPLNSVIKFVLPEKYFRSFYALSSGLALATIIYFWQPMPTVVWSIKSNTAANTVIGLSILGYIGVAVSILTLDALSLDIIGLKDPLWRLMRWKPTKPTLISTGLYALMRHPAYTMLMIGIWCTPRMTVGHLLLSTTLTLYMVLAVKYSEEPALLKEMGKEYADFMEKTPCFIPSFTQRHKSKKF